MWKSENFKSKKDNCFWKLNIIEECQSVKFKYKIILSTKMLKC